MSYPQAFRTEHGLQPLGNFGLGGEEEDRGAVFAPRDCTHPLPQVSGESGAHISLPVQLES